MKLWFAGDRSVESKPEAVPSSAVVKEQGFLCGESICGRMRMCGWSHGSARGRSVLFEIFKGKNVPVESST